MEMDLVITDLRIYFELYGIVRYSVFFTLSV